MSAVSAADEIRKSVNDPRRFIGRRACRCRRCSGVAHYVNRVGGVICLACNPPAEGDCTLRLDYRDGEWAEANVNENAPALDISPEPDIDVEAVIAWAEGRAIGSVRSRTTTRADGWSSEMGEVVDWYRGARMLGMLPTEPFRLWLNTYSPKSLAEAHLSKPGLIVEPDRFFDSLDIEVNVQGPHGPRVASGALLAELRRLREIATVDPKL